MTFAERKLLVLATCVGTIATVGLILAANKPGLWIFVACFALVTAAIGNWLWDEPTATLVPVIAKVRR